MHRTIQGTLPLGFLGLVFALILHMTAVQTAVGTEFDTANSITAPLRDAVYNHSLSELEIRSLYRSSLARIESEVSSVTLILHTEALIHYYLGRYYQAIKTRKEMIAYAEDLRNHKYLALRKYYTDRDAALAAYNMARSAAELYLELKPGAEAHSLYGEILGQMLFLGTAGQALSIGPKARKQVKTALELDSRHVKALIQEASRLAYSPSNYGGDPDGARNLYREILRIGSADKEDLFNIYGGFAMAAFMEGHDDEAISWFNEALLLYPGNIFVSGMAGFLQESSL